MFVPEPVLQQFSSGVLRAMVRDAVVLSRSDSVLWAGMSGDLRLPADRAVPHPVPSEAANDVTRYESSTPPSPSRR